MYSSDKKLLTATERALSKSGFTLLASSRPRDFLIAIKRGAYEMLLIDASDERVDRAEMLRAVRKLDADAPVIILLPESELGFLPEALSLGADDVLAAPVRMIELRARVAGRYGRAHANSASKASAQAADTPNPRPLDTGLLRSLALFHERCLREFIDLERKVLSYREQLAEISGISNTESGDATQHVLLVHPNPHLAEKLAQTAKLTGVSLSQAFTGGGALDHAGQHEIDAVICAADLPDLDGEVVAASLKGEYPYIDAVRLVSFGADKGRAVFLQSADGEGTVEPQPAANVDDLAALIELIAQRHSRREADKRLARAFKERHRDFMRDYANLKIELLRAMDTLAPGSSAVFRNRSASSASGSIDSSSDQVS